MVYWVKHDQALQYPLDYLSGPHRLMFGFRVYKIAVIGVTFPMRVVKSPVVSGGDLKVVSSSLGEGSPGL